MVIVSETYTAGDFALGTMTIPPLNGPMCHVHSREDEAVLVRSGSFEYLSQGRRLRAEAGDTAWMPRNVARSFHCVDSTPGELVGVFLPGDFINYFREGVQLFASGQANEVTMNRL